MSVARYPSPNFIENELRRTGVQMVTTSDHVMMACPFHLDTAPSLSIALTSSKVPPGVFNCFGCHISGTWNKLAKRLGVRLWGIDEDDGEVYIYRSKKEIKDELETSGLKLYKWTDDYKWKRYSTKFLSKFGAKLLVSGFSQTDYLYLPIPYLNEIYGYCRVRLHENDPGPKYWFNKDMTKSLYPIDYILENSTNNYICLVEGIADAFRCIKNGISALALLGVEITPFMMNQIEGLAVENIVLCLDGDSAGWAGMKKLYPRLKKAGYNVKIMKLPDSTDPDSVSSKYIRKLKELCESLK